MWTCPNCERIFEKVNQVHSCHKIPINQHFKNKGKAREIFNYLVGEINNKIGKCKIISLPCCVHLFGTYDFLAALPKKDRLEIRFSLDRKLNNPRIKQSVPLSLKNFKNCIDINSKSEIDETIIDWLNQSFYLKDNN